MNPQETLELTDFIKEIKEKYNLSVFMIEHHMDLVMQISDRIYVLDFGKTIASGTPEEIQKNPRVIDAYLGRKKSNGHSIAYKKGKSDVQSCKNIISEREVFCTDI